MVFLHFFHWWVFYLCLWESIYIIFKTKTGVLGTTYKGWLNTRMIIIYGRCRHCILRWPEHCRKILYQGRIFNSRVIPVAIVDDLLYLFLDIRYTLYTSAQVFFFFLTQNAQNLRMPFYLIFSFKPRQL